MRQPGGESAEEADEQRHHGHDQGYEQEAAACGHEVSECYEHDSTLAGLASDSIARAEEAATIEGGVVFYTFRWMPSG
ncbi:hypothetical protein GCM10023318_06120 [Nocardia callitridis]|uniref:Uncharacterized protein n=1 Tax=Nocardia callitridis TaxID=648753 RepID=A0ABP9JT38_9NOCA